jgi:hypothetical protein
MSAPHAPQRARPKDDRGEHQNDNDLACRKNAKHFSIPLSANHRDTT